MRDYPYLMKPVAYRRDDEATLDALRERLEREREAVVPRDVKPQRNGKGPWEPWQEERLWWMRTHGLDLDECAREVGHEDTACVAKMRELAKVRGRDALKTWRERRPAHAAV